MQNDQQHCWTQLLSTISLDTLIPAAFRISPLTSVLTQTTTNITDARHCNPSPSSLIFTLLNMDTPSKAWIPPVFLIFRHQPFISPLQSYLAKLLVQQKNFNNQPSSTKTSSLPFLHCLSSTFLINSSGPTQLYVHHHLLSSYRPPSFHLPSSIQLHASPSFAPPPSCTP